MRALALALVAASLACGGPDPIDPDPLPVADDTRASSPKHGTAPSASGSGSAAPSPVPPSTPGEHTEHWRGSLAETLPVVFGSRTCEYRITLRDVAAEVVLVDGAVVSATVTATAVEETIPPNIAKPIPANAHTYVLVSSATLPNGVLHLELAPLAANQPEAALVVEGQLLGGSPALGFSWHRIDNGAPFDWRVTAVVGLSRS